MEYVLESSRFVLSPYVNTSSGINDVIIVFLFNRQVSRQKPADILLGNALVSLDTGDIENAQFQFEVLTDEHGSTRSGKISQYYLGSIYFDKGDYEKAMDYYERSLTIDEELGYTYGMGSSLGNIGNVHYNKGDLDTALDYYERSLKIDEELGDKRGVGKSLNNIGWTYYEIGKYNKALECYNRGLKINEELDDKHSISNDFTNMGLVYFQQEDYNSSILI